MRADVISAARAEARAAASVEMARGREALREELLAEMMLSLDGRLAGATATAVTAGRRAASGVATEARAFFLTIVSSGWLPALLPSPCTTDVSPPPSPLAATHNAGGSAA